MDVRFHPLTWQGPSTPAKDRRSRYTFRVGWTDTLELLTKELELLGARDIVIEVGLSTSEIRLDGWPRANAREPQHPGVRLAFESRHGPLIYQTDAYDGWQANVRALALSLQALRAVDRYGVTKRGEQYTGWKALPAGSSPAPVDTRMSREDAITTVLRLAGMTVQAPMNRAAVMSENELRKPILVRARRAAHPDTGGSDEEFQRLSEALDVLGVS
jgi:hypothetical protein